MVILSAQEYLALQKAFTHKYVKKVPVGVGPHGRMMYRYYYKDEKGNVYTTNVPKHEKEKPKKKEQIPLIVRKLSDKVEAKTDFEKKAVKPLEKPLFVVKLNKDKEPVVTTKVTDASDEPTEKETEVPAPTGEMTQESGSGPKIVAPKHNEEPPGAQHETLQEFKSDKGVVRLVRDKEGKKFLTAEVDDPQKFKEFYTTGAVWGKVNLIVHGRLMPFLAGEWLDDTEKRKLFLDPYFVAAVKCYAAYNTPYTGGRFITEDEEALRPYLRGYQGQMRFTDFSQVYPDKMLNSKFDSNDPIYPVGRYLSADDVADFLKKDLTGKTFTTFVLQFEKFIESGKISESVRKEIMHNFGPSGHPKLPYQKELDNYDWPMWFHANWEEKSYNARKTYGPFGNYQTPVKEFVPHIEDLYNLLSSTNTEITERDKIKAYTFLKRLNADYGVGERTLNGYKNYYENTMPLSDKALDLWQDIRGHLQNLDTLDEIQDYLASERLHYLQEFGADGRQVISALAAYVRDRFADPSDVKVLGESVYGVDELPYWQTTSPEELNLKLGDRDNISFSFARESEHTRGTFTVRYEGDPENTAIKALSATLGSKPEIANVEGVAYINFPHVASGQHAYNLAKQALHLAGVAPYPEAFQPFPHHDPEEHKQKVADLFGSGKAGFKAGKKASRRDMVAAIVNPHERLQVALDDSHRALKDAGAYIPASAKEKWWANFGLHEINLENLEADPTLAAKLVTRDNLIGKFSAEQYASLGYSAGACKLIQAVYAAIPAKPENNAKAREAYSDVVVSLQRYLHGVGDRSFDGLRSTLWEFYQLNLQPFSHRLQHAIGAENRQLKSTVMGKRFTNILTTRSAQSKTDGSKFEKNDDWSWTGKGKRKPRESTGLTWTRDVPAEFSRSGPSVKKIKGEKGLLTNFGLRGVQFGTSVSDKDRKFHVDAANTAFADLADVLQMDPNDVSFKGRLALAIGARGSGVAMAHYEPDLAVINLTKFSGAGSLAHEWGHFLDNILARTSKPTSAKTDYATTSKRSELAYYDPEVSGALQELTNALFYRTWEDFDVSGRPAAERLKWLQLARRGGKPPSAYVERSSKFKGKYWVKNVELFARAFDAYVADSLEAKKRHNNYLTSGVPPKDFEGDAYPFPSGDERRKINKAFDKFFAVLRKTDSLKKALRLFSRDLKMPYGYA